jgi:hypothetical protein
VNQVSSSLRRGETWNCRWCETPNASYTRRNDPAAATVTDLAEDMGRRGVSFTPRTPRTAQQPQDTQPVLIVTTNEIPGYRITYVHGDVFGLTVRARNYFSNLGAQFRTLAGSPGGGFDFVALRALPRLQPGATTSPRSARLTISVPAALAAKWYCRYLGRRPPRSRR